MSAEEQRLLEAVIEEPDDDAPRLVYADWLSSRGDPRGELIQLQCQLAAVPDDERRRSIRMAENKLLETHGAAWTRPLHALLPPAQPLAPYKFTFVRGFIEDVSIPLACMSDLRALFAAAPLVRRLRILPDAFGGLPFAQPRLDRALEAPELERLVGLEISLPGGGNQLARDVAAASRLRGLRELRIQASVWAEQAVYFNVPGHRLVLDDAGASALAASTGLAHLDVLDLGNNRITNAGLHALGTGRWQLRRLDLSSNLLGPDRLDEAFEGPMLRSVRELSLVGNPIAEAFAEVVQRGRLPALRDLDLERCHLGAAGTAALCQALAAPTLRHLRLERNSLCDAGAHAIAGCEGLAALRSFEAGHNRIGHKGALALATSPYLANLERLTLNEPRWKPETEALFKDSMTLARTKIYLRGRLVARSKKSGVTSAVPEPAPELATRRARASARLASGSGEIKRPRKARTELKRS